MGIQKHNAVHIAHLQSREVGRKFMPEFTFEQIAQAVEGIDKQTGTSYLLSYREFVTYFAELDSITVHNFIIGAHFVYGWMPRVLTLRGPNGGFKIVVDMLNDVKRGRLLNAAALVVLRDVINNSLVGTSKLLHFINPADYAIWDRRVYTFVNSDEPNNYQMRDSKAYLSYMTNCRQIASDKRFPPLHTAINARIGYAVSPLRAIEWVMYPNVA